MKRDIIIFDMDGTLADTMAVGLEVANQFLRNKGKKEITESNLQDYRSQPSFEFIRGMGISKFQLPGLARAFRKELETNMHEIKPFNEVRPTLQILKERGYQMLIISSNSKKNIQTFLKTSEMEAFFIKVEESSRLFGKSRVIKKILKELNFTTARVVCIGDETRDVTAANALGIPCIAVSWGFNSREILEKTGAWQICDHPRELLKHLP